MKSKGTIKILVKYMKNTVGELLLVLLVLMPLDFFCGSKGLMGSFFFPALIPFLIITLMGGTAVEKPNPEYLERIPMKKQAFNKMVAVVLMVAMGCGIVYSQLAFRTASTAMDHFAYPPIYRELWFVRAILVLPYLLLLAVMYNYLKTDYQQEKDKNRLRIGLLLILISNGLSLFNLFYVDPWRIFLSILVPMSMIVYLFYDLYRKSKEPKETSQSVFVELAESSYKVSSKKENNEFFFNIILQSVFFIAMDLSRIGIVLYIVIVVVMMLNTQLVRFTFGSESILRLLPVPFKKIMYSFLSLMLERTLLALIVLLGLYGIQFFFLNIFDLNIVMGLSPLEAAILLLTTSVYSYGISLAYFSRAEAQDKPLIAVTLSSVLPIFIMSITGVNTAQVLGWSLLFVIVGLVFFKRSLKKKWNC